MHFLLELDRYLFLTLNHLPHGTLTDALALILSGVGTYGFVWVIFGLRMFLREEQKDRWFFIQFVLAACISLLSVEILLKPMVGRLRPFTEMVAVVIGQASNGFSFPSGHATFAFALAVVLARKEPRYASWLYLLAFVVSFTRIYLGQHYPADVVVGGLLGWVIGNLAIAASNRLRTYVGMRTKRARKP